MNLLGFYRSKMTRERLDAFIASHASDKKTLDIGSARSPYARHFPNRTSLDISESAGADITADAHALPLPDASYELILATEVLEHLHTPEQAIAEMRRVLVPGGTLILTTRFVFPLHDEPHDYFRYTKYGLRHLFRDWDIVSLEAETSDMGTFAVLLQRQAFNPKRDYFPRSLFAAFARLLHMCVRKREDGIMPSGYHLVALKH